MEMFNEREKALIEWLRKLPGDVSWKYVRALSTGDDAVLREIEKQYGFEDIGEE